MRFPNFLKPNDSVAIVSPAKFIEKEIVYKAKQIIENWGLKVILSPNVLSQKYAFAGTDEQRIKDFQWALDDKNIKAIICSRGGYGSIRIIDYINFDNFKQNPKWIIGYSDITVFHSHINKNFNIATLHATTPLNFQSQINTRALKSLKETIFGNVQKYNIASHKLNKKGENKGIVVGGNLSILHNLIGTNSDIDTNNKILFIEDVAEYKYHIDRMLLALKKSDKLNNLKGLIVGSFTNIKADTYFTKSIKEIIKDVVKNYNYPVCFNFPTGHKIDNRCLIIGGKAFLSVDEDKVKLHFLSFL